MKKLKIADLKQRSVSRLASSVGSIELKDELLPKIRVNILPVAGEDALDAPLVSAQGVVAGRTRMRHLVKTVNAAGNAGAGPGSYKAEHSTDDPGQGARLGGGPGGDVVLAVGAHHGHSAVPKTGSLHVLHLGDHLYRGLGLHGLWGREATCLLRQRGVHLARGAWGVASRGRGTLGRVASRRGTMGRVALPRHGCIITRGHCRHRLLELLLLHRRGTHGVWSCDLSLQVYPCLFPPVLRIKSYQRSAGRWCLTPGNLQCRNTSHSHHVQCSGTEICP